MSELIQTFKNILGDNGVIEGDAVGQKIFNCQAEVIVRPTSTAEVSSVLKLCHEHNRAVVTMGGLTGLVSGCATKPGDIALSLERMNRIEEIDDQNHTITVQAGVPLQQIQETAEEQALIFPLDLGARGSATIGGNIATNAGGNNVLRFGMTRQLILGLEAVLADGTVISSMCKVLKNNTGYDLKQWFIGSEGTLGVVTRAILRLYPAPRTQHTALLALNEFQSVIDLLHLADSSLGGSLTSYEVMWNAFFEHVVHQRNKHRAPFEQKFPYYVLLETSGSAPQTDTIQFENMLENCLESGLIANAVVTKSKAERDALWAIRDDVEALFELYPIFVYDISLAVDAMEVYVEKVHNALAAKWPDYRCIEFGHLGDGNLHLVIAMGSDSAEAHMAVDSIVYGNLREHDGVVSAEHGIGLDKKDFLSVSRSDVEIQLMKKIKLALDPKNLLNPGKIFTI